MHLLFPHGRIVATPGANEAIPTDGMVAALRRHLTGDYGDLDDEDKQANNWSLKHGERILSVYTHEGTRFYILTERDRSITTFLLPEEY